MGPCLCQEYVKAVVNTPSPEMLRHARERDTASEANSVRKRSAAYKAKRAVARATRRKRDSSATSAHTYGDAHKRAKPATGKAKTVGTLFCNLCLKRYVLLVHRNRHQASCTVQPRSAASL